MRRSIVGANSCKSRHKITRATPRDHEAENLNHRSKQRRMTRSYQVSEAGALRVNGRHRKIDANRKQPDKCKAGKVEYAYQLRYWKQPGTAWLRPDKPTRKTPHTVAQPSTTSPVAHDALQDYIAQCNTRFRGVDDAIRSSCSFVESS